MVIASLLASAGGVFGWLAIRKGDASRVAFFWMLGAFAAQLMALGWRGELRGQCPLNDVGEICLFLAWSMTLFYLVTGTTYRLSLLGTFSVPLVILLQIIALVPGAFTESPARAKSVDAWREFHAAFSVLSYGALALSAVAGFMFLVLNHRLKSHHFAGGLVHGMPSVHRLVKAMGRITLVGWIVLTIGVISGLKMEGGVMNAHLLVATVTWVLYAVLLGVYFVRGIPGRQLAWGVLILFVASLLVFAKL
ncbi:cytochrome c biogenesis protein CcsA [Verrucomicrobiaceae bacterium 227]